MRIHADDRRLLFADIFPTNHGDVNVIRLYGGALSAWHRHQRQTDHFFCVSGRVRLGAIGPEDVLTWMVLDEHQPGVATIPPNTWHGYQGFAGDAILLMWADRKYDGTDEERKTVDEIGITWERIPR